MENLYLQEVMKRITHTVQTKCDVSASQRPLSVNRIRHAHSNMDRACRKNTIEIKSQYIMASHKSLLYNNM